MVPGCVQSSRRMARRYSRLSSAGRFIGAESRRAHSWARPYVLLEHINREGRRWWW